MMADIQLTKEIKWHGVIVILKIGQSDLVMSLFLKIARFYIYKVCKELEIEYGNVPLVAKHKNHTKRSDIITTPEFFSNLNKPLMTLTTAEKQWSLGKVIEDVLKGAKSIVVHEDKIRYNSYAIWKGHFMSEKKNNHI